MVAWVAVSFDHTTFDHVLMASIVLVINQARLQLCKFCSAGKVVLRESDDVESFVSFSEVPMHLSPFDELTQVTPCFSFRSLPWQTDKKSAFILVDVLRKLRISTKICNGCELQVSKLRSPLIRVEEPLMPHVLPCREMYEEQERKEETLAKHASAAERKVYKWPIIGWGKESEPKTKAQALGKRRYLLSFSTFCF